MHFTKVTENRMILLHCYGKRVIQVAGKRLLSSVATFYLGDRNLVPPSSYVGVTALYSKT